jgi:predicted ester cyclase
VARTRTASFLGIPATGRAVTVSAITLLIALLSVADGRVTHLRGIFDQPGLPRQLGVVPSEPVE